MPRREPSLTKSQLAAYRKSFRWVDIHEERLTDEEKNWVNRTRVLIAQGRGTYYRNGSRLCAVGLGPTGERKFWSIDERSPEIMK